MRDDILRVSSGTASGLQLQGVQGRVWRFREGLGTLGFQALRVLLVQGLSKTRAFKKARGCGCFEVGRHVQTDNAHSP